MKKFGAILVVKEREMEIGYPTDVKHVAHIGWDGPSGTAPSWVRYHLHHHLVSISPLSFRFFNSVCFSLHNFTIWVSTKFPLFWADE